MGLARGAPELGVNPNADDLDEAVRLWPIVRAMIANLLDDGRPYTLEGVCLSPTQVAEFKDAVDVQICFLGYPSLTADEKATQIIQHAGGPNDWLSSKPVEMIRKHAREGVQVSQRLKDQCACYDLPFFDTGLEFQGSLKSAEEFLMSPRNHIRSFAQMLMTAPLEQDDIAERVPVKPRETGL